MTEFIDKEFSPVLAMVMERGPVALERYRTGIHANVAPEVVDHCRVLVMEAKKFAERLLVNKKDLEAQEKRLVAELNEQRSIILGEMEREVGEAKAKMKALKERREQAELNLLTSGNSSEHLDTASGSGSNTGSLPPSPVRGANTTAIGSSTNSSQPQKSAASALLASLNKKDGDNHAPPGDVDYWRAQAQDLHLVVEGRRETLKSVQARIRSVSHLSEHQERARNIIGLLRKAEAEQKQKAAEYLHKAHQIREQAGLGGGGSNNSTTQGHPNQQNQNQRDDPTNASAIAMLTEAETNGLESILNVLEPRVEVAKEALRLYTGRAEKLQKRLEAIETRRKQLAQVGNTLPQVLKYVNEVKTDCQLAIARVDPPNLAIVNILKKQHGEALQRLSRSSDSLVALKMEVSELEQQVREARVNCIRSMHGTATGTTERLNQLRALRAAEVVQKQILGIENECDRLRGGVFSSGSGSVGGSLSSNNNRSGLGSSGGGRTRGASFGPSPNAF